MARQSGFAPCGCVRARRSTIGRAFLFPVFAVVCAACQMGPIAVREGQAEYNEAIQDVEAEQLLLNLVRLKYREAPMVLDVGSISAQFEFSRAASISGNLQENVSRATGSTIGRVNIAPDANTGGVERVRPFTIGSNPDSLSIGAEMVFAERPTVTYTPLKGDDFVKRMLRPISRTTIVMLANSGWNINRVFSLVVQEMNGLDNVGSASGPTPALAPKYERFLEALAIMRDLQMQRAIWVELETHDTEISRRIPAEQVTPELILQARSGDLGMKPVGDAGEWALVEGGDRLILGLSETEQSAPLVARLRELLRLTPDRTRYEVALAQTQTPTRFENGRLSDQITVTTRSLLGVMFYLSQSVEAPSRHVRAGLVTRTLDASGEAFDWSKALGHLMTVHAGVFPPPEGSIRVRKDGYWYYIRPDDLNSKSTFLLLSQLFTLQAGATAVGTGPMLTLPVGG